jgi:hypothetical protein
MVDSHEPKALNLWPSRVVILCSGIAILLQVDAMWSSHRLLPLRLAIVGFSLVAILSSLRGMKLIQKR